MRKVVSKEVTAGGRFDFFWTLVVMIWYNTPCSSGFQPGFPGILGFRQHSPGVPPEVIQMLRLNAYFSSPMRKCKQGLLERLVYILTVALHEKG